MYVTFANDADILKSVDDFNFIISTMLCSIYTRH